MGVLSLIVFVPLIAVLLLFFLPAKNNIAVRMVATGASFIVLFMCLVLLFDFDRSGGLQYVEKHVWISELGIQYFLALDGMGLLLVFLNALILFCGVLASFALKEKVKEFHILLLLLATGVFGVFLSFDLFLFFLFYELAVFPMFFLIGIWGSGRKIYAAMKLTLLLFFGSSFVLLAFLALSWLNYMHTGVPSFDIQAISAAVRQGNFSFSTQITFGVWQVDFAMFFYPVLFVGFGLLSGLFPFHTWSPDGHASAPTAVSMLHAGVLMKLGAFGILRIAIPFLPEAALTWSLFFALVGLVNVVYGAFCALNQTDLKYIVGYSSVSHMGFVLIGVSVLNMASMQGAVLQMFAHGLMTALCFFLIGIIYGRTGKRDIRELGGLAQPMPFVALSFSVAAFASLGLPGLPGFLAELMIMIGAMKNALSPLFGLISLLALGGILVTAIYLLRAVQYIFYASPGNQEADLKTVTENPVSAEGSVLAIKDAGIIERAGLIVLLAMLFLTGILPAWAVKLVQGSVESLVSVLGGVS